MFTLHISHCRVVIISAITKRAPLVNEVRSVEWVIKFLMAILGILTYSAHLKHRKPILHKWYRILIFKSIGRDLCLYLPSWKGNWFSHCSVSKKRHHNQFNSYEESIRLGVCLKFHKCGPLSSKQGKWYRDSSWKLYSEPQRGSRS